MKVNVRLFGFGLNIVIVLASALVASVSLYLAAKRHLGNQPVTNLTIWLETNKNCSRLSKGRAIHVAFGSSWSWLEIKCQQKFQRCLWSASVFENDGSDFLMRNRRKAARTIGGVSCAIVVLVHLSVLIPLRLQLIGRWDLNLVETSNWILMDFCWIHSSSLHSSL